MVPLFGSQTYLLDTHGLGGNGGQEGGAERDRVYLSREAARQVFNELYGSLVRYLATQVRSLQDARDVAQEAFLRFLEKADSRDPGVLRAFLFRIATNIALDQLRHDLVRRETERRGLLEQQVYARAEMYDPAQQFLARERLEQVSLLLDELSHKCRQACELRLLHGLPQLEVGKEMGVSPRMVRRYISYAMKYCRLRLQGLSADQVRQMLVL